MTLKVIPAKAGIHSFQIIGKAGIPFFKGMTTLQKVANDPDRHSCESRNPFISAG
jgi:hypothetical protein